MSEPLLVGFGRRVITPPLGTPLTGYSPARPAESVHDDLNIIVLLLQQGDRKILVAAEDTCNPGNAALEQRQAMAEAAGLPLSCTSVSAVHTHSGPATWAYPPFRDVNEKFFREILLPMSREAAAEAAANLEPAEVGIGTALSDVAVNRRQLKEDGKVILGQELLDLYDPEMTVLSFRSSADGHILGNLVHYGCHNTASGKNPEITRDWCGVMKDRLEQENGGVTMFVNGCEGDCGPRLPNGKTVGDLQLALELGGKAAVDACRAFRDIREWRRPTLRIYPGMMRLPYERPEDHGGAEFYPLPVTVWSLDSLAFLPSPFENFAETTMRIRRHSPFAHTLVVSQSNYRGGYLPTRKAMPLLGYEVDFYDRLDYGFAGTDEGFIAESGRVLRELFAGNVPAEEQDPAAFPAPTALRKK